MSQQLVGHGLQTIHSRLILGRKAESLESVPGPDSYICSKSGCIRQQYSGDVFHVIFGDCLQCSVYSQGSCSAIARCTWMVLTRWAHVHWISGRPSSRSQCYNLIAANDIRQNEYGFYSRWKRCIVIEQNHDRKFNKEPTYDRPYSSWSVLMYIDDRPPGRVISTC